MKWVGNHVEIEKVPKRLKKITGTRFAAILGANIWSTPFEMWLQITKTYEKPFEGSIYTEAGKIIEPKQAEYMAKAYGMNIVTPTDRYGEDYFSKTFGDFFPNEKIFGGMWDYLAYDDEGNLDAVLEMKTTKRAEDWADDIPEYYALQGALYGYLLGTDDVIMVCSILEDQDYQDPYNFEPKASNTIVRPFRISERYPHFEKLVAEAMGWWNQYVVTGVSPDFDEKKDKESLAELRKKVMPPETNENDVIAEAEKLLEEIDIEKEKMKEKENRLAEITDFIKKKAIESFEEGTKQVVVEGNKYTFSVNKSVTKTIDKDLLKADGLLEKYQKTSESYRLTTKRK